MTHQFKTRHIQLTQTEQRLKTVGVDSLDALMDHVVPDSIRLTQKPVLPEPLTESQLLAHLKQVGRHNKQYKTYIGQGYYGCYTPSVLQRNIFENPGWYTAYTPYQPEISQGRLEALYHFQTMVSELTGLPLANASLLDEATAACEAMSLLFRTRTDRSKTTFGVDEAVFPQTMAVLRGRAEAIGITIQSVASPEAVSSDTFGVLVQYPNRWGGIQDLSDWVAACHKQGAKLAVATDLLALVIVKPPGEWDVSVVIGTTQRFGVPMGYGGPHAAFISAKADYKRQLPGRIIGLSKDRLGNAAYRMALQTREQHIRREKATSNICTAQALLAVMAALYALYHGPQGLRDMAIRIHHLTCRLAKGLTQAGFQLRHACFFDTVTIIVEAAVQKQIQQAALAKQLNFYYDRDRATISISFDETTTLDDVLTILSVFPCQQDGQEQHVIDTITIDHLGVPRQTPCLKDAVFQRYHTETDMMRYIKQLENNDFSLVHGMIPLGSCTMKLNAATQLMPVSWPEFSQLHPFVPIDQAVGYDTVIKGLEQDLATLTGFSAVSLQPNSGAQGELAGLLVIKAYHAAHHATQRTVVLIPESAHGTNPASAAIAGLTIVSLRCDDQGNICVSDLDKKVTQYSDRLFGLMITYPSTHGVFETQVKEICETIHEHGGQVYMDGANLNAQLGFTNPQHIGADVCHVNLHKTFAIPHGGGGPGMGPIAVAEHLVSFLPTHPYQKTGDHGIAPISAAAWGSASILLISYAYNRLLGLDGIMAATQYAILNANYIRARLKDHYSVLYTDSSGFVAHELILDCRMFRRTASIDVEDIAKRLIDYGFHGPTMSWPVPGTLMIEPTESESLAELDRFCDAMIAIRHEISAIESGQADRMTNVLKNAPHPRHELMADHWPHPYSRKVARCQFHGIAPVARLDNAYGDRQLMGACEPVVSTVR